MTYCVEWNIKRYSPALTLHSIPTINDHMKIFKNGSSMYYLAEHTVDYCMALLDVWCGALQIPH